MKPAAASSVQAWLRLYWPALSFVGVLALLPVSRSVELPLLIMLIGGIIIAIQQRAALLREPTIRLFSLLFICFWLPVAISALDAYNADKAWSTTLSMLRLLPVGWFAIWTLREPARRRWLMVACAMVLAVWTVDAIVQAMVGRNLFGMPHPPLRLNGIFDDNLKLGQVLAVTCPLLLLHSWRHWPRWLSVGIGGAVFLVVLLSGTRTAWIMLALIGLVLAGAAWRQHRQKILLPTVSVLALMVALASISYAFSPNLQQRVERSLQALSGDATGVDVALSTRLPIWQTSVAMAQQHWVNGVGVRSFRFAYEEFAEPDDPWLELMAERGAYHAHQIVLEAATETGLFGLLGWLALLVMLVAHWRSLSSDQRSTAAPFAIGLLAMVFPLNSHLAFYSTFWSIVFWWMVIGYLAMAASSDRQTSP